MLELLDWQEWREKVYASYYNYFGDLIEIAIYIIDTLLFCK